ncbi:hypothetical protein FRC07_011833 [Ceratobasidium sp. 392]|nr:hypothetical protein FRC07_011833 [Ceratobasidium sp. 392]
MSDPHPLAKQIAAINGFLAAADVIRTNLKLPDLSTSSGLRQVARSPHKVYPRLEKAYTDHLKDPLVLAHRPTATKSMHAHLLGFLRATASRLHFNISSDASTVHFIIAHFPSTNFATRASALLALHDLYATGAEHERSSWDPNAYYDAAVKAQTELPEDILERMEEHTGTILQNDIYVNTRATDEFQSAMTDVLEDKDMYALAKRLYPMILATESSVPQGAFRGKDGELLSTEELELPFSSFVDALPHAAEAIRARGIPHESVAADTLDVKYALLTRDYAGVRRICTERIESDPSIGFFYYALVLSAGSSSGDPTLRRMPTTERLKLAKRGLLCDGSTPYIRLGLHKVAAECAHKLGMDRLKVASGPAMGPVHPAHVEPNSDSEDDEISPRKTMQLYTEAIVFLRSALDDARTYSKHAPLDYRLHKNVLLLQTLLSIVLEGEGPVIVQQTIVDQLYTALYNPIPKSQTRLTVNIIVPNWEIAQQEWDAILRKFDTRAPTGNPPHTHNHPHEQDLSGELDPELVSRFESLGRPPTYISTLEIPIPNSLIAAEKLDPDQEREEEKLRQAYVALAAWMEGVPSSEISASLGDSLITPITATPITPSPLNTSSTLARPPCPLDRQPHVDVHAVPIMQYKCYACGNPSDGSELKTCSGCRRTKYCDEICQKKHWVNGHGDECLTV